MQATEEKKQAVPMIQAILDELREEAPAIRRILERVPNDKLGWKPHAKSRSLGELANHIANIPGMAERVAKHEEFSPGTVAPTAATSSEGIRANFEKNVRLAEEILSQMTEKEARAEWRLVFQGKEVFRLPRVAVLRKTMLNHLYHHRGQLSVYLRLLEVPVPMVYGPTADENPFG